MDIGVKQSHPPRLIASRRETAADKLEASWQREQHTRQLDVEFHDGSAAGPVPMRGGGAIYHHGHARLGARHG
jgi:hypothetical protein